MSQGHRSMQPSRALQSFSELPVRGRCNCAKPEHALRHARTEAIRIDEKNLYQTPSAQLHQEAETIATGSLYTPVQVFLATFLGSPLAGGWLIAANYKALGRHDAQLKCLLAGVIATLVSIAAALFLPDTIPGLLIPAALAAATQQVASKLQGEQIEHHLSTGGKKHSVWRVVGVALLAIVVALVLVLATVFVLPESLLPA